MSFKVFGIHVVVLLLFLLCDTLSTAETAAAEATAASEEHGTEKKCLKRQGPKNRD